MMRPFDIMGYLEAVEADGRLNVWHAAILVAIVLMAGRQGGARGIKVSRSRIMGSAHIRTLPTYHKYFRELQELDYIAYRPSYHPGVRSEIDILIQPLS